MKKVITSVLCLVICMVLSSGSFSKALNVSLDQDVFDDCWQNVKAQYSDKVTELEAVEKEYCARSALAHDVNMKMIDYVNSHNDVLSESFGGSYINDEGDLVVTLTENVDQCADKILELFNYTPAEFILVTNSYKDLMAEKNEIDEILIDYFSKYNEKAVMSQDEKLVVNSIGSVIYSDYTNDITVEFREITEGDVSLLSNANNLNSKISSFKKCVSDSDLIHYKEATTEEAVTSTDWRPGRSLYLYAGLFQDMTGFSTGYRTRYVYNGTTYYGFVTCAHGKGNEIGKPVYLQENTSSVNKVGVILNRRVGSCTLDTAFIKMESGFNNSQYIYWTSSVEGITRPGAYLDGTETGVSTGLKVYKSGKTTYLTSGTVVGASISNSLFDESTETRIYVSDMFSTANIGSGGDSGGVTYIMNADGLSAKAVGTYEGTIGAFSCFIKAVNIKNVFGAEAY